MSILKNLDSDSAFYLKPGSRPELPVRNFLVHYNFYWYLLLIYYLPPDFGGDEKPKGGPLEIEKIFVEGGRRKGLEGGHLKPSSSSKTPLGFFYKRENKFFKSGWQIIDKYLFIPLVY